MDFKALASALAAVSVIGFAPSAFAQDRKVTIVNSTDFVIVEFYGSNAGTDSWEEDILGSDVLGSGEKVEINFDDGTGHCKFDFKAVFNDGDEVIESGVNVCEVGTFTFQ